MKSASFLFILVLAWVLTSCNKKEEREKAITGHWKLKNEDVALDLEKSGSFTVIDERGGKKTGKWEVSQKGDSLLIRENKARKNFEILKLDDKELQLYEPIAADSMNFER